MKIPKKLKIGAVTYEVIIATEWKGRDENGHDGECFYDRVMGHKIYIGAELSREAQEVTFLHEVLHALNSTMDHEFLDSLSEQLYQVLADNNLLR